MIKAVVIDDEEKARKVLIRLISEINQDVEVIGEGSSVSHGFEVINKLNPQLVFLDIEMLDGTGFNLLEKFEQLNFDVIFTTAYDQYAIKAFKYSATDYLLKPINIDELEQAILKINKNKINSEQRFELLDNLLQNLSPNNKFKKIAIKSTKAIDYISLYEIIYCRTDTYLTEFFLKDHRIIVSTIEFKGLEDLLDENYFFRISKSHFINTNYVVSFNKVQSVVTLLNKYEIEVSRRKKKEFMEFMEKKISA